jgi:putative two-component system response regulator
MRQSILFVDDEERVLIGIRRLLHNRQDGWQLHFATGVDEALGILGSCDIDAVVSDINMPGKDGFALLAAILNTEGLSHVPVIMLTGSSESDLKRRALEAGATDLLTKPVLVEDLIARLRSALRLKSFQDEIRVANREIRIANRALEQRVKERTSQLEASRLDMALRLAKVAELHDRETGDHIARVGAYCRATAEALDLGSAFVDLLFVASPLHDIGKIGISDSILNKPGRLTSQERRVMETHCDIGFQILNDRTTIGLSMFTPLARDHSVRETLGNPLIELAATIALTHHEKWDGSGYPRGLKGENIPLAGRMVAVADVFDALCSKRPYKPAFPREKAFQIMAESAGSHFDPEVYSGFLRGLDSIPDYGEWYDAEDDDGLSRAA